MNQRTVRGLNEPCFKGAGAGACMHCVANEMLKKLGFLFQDGPAIMFVVT